MHAYLILAHEDIYLLEKQLLLLDDKRNDIYIHIDKKYKNFPFKYIRSIVKKSRIFFVKRRNVQWGSFNMILAELELYACAYEKGYAYYHLLSGMDLPIKDQDTIHNFFQQYENIEFLKCVSKTDIRYSDREYRFKYYYFYYGNNKYLKKLNYAILKIQKAIGVDRYRGKYDYRFGSQWASLTHKAVGILLQNKKTICKRYRFSLCCDEVYKQTILFDKNIELYNGTMPNARMIVWDASRGTAHPIIFTKADYEMLKSADGCMFARKFSSRVDKEIIDILYDELTHNTKVEI